MDSRLHSLRTTLAFMIAPIAPVVILIAFSVASWDGNGLDRLVSETLWMGGAFAIIGYATALVLGFPLYVFLLSHSRNALWLYITAGAALACTAYIILNMPLTVEGNGFQLSKGFLSTLSSQLPLGILYGALSAATFWLIARPDITK